MSTLVVIATDDADLAEAWERQLPSNCIPLRPTEAVVPHTFSSGLIAVVVLDAAWGKALPQSLSRSPLIFVGEPRSQPFEQAKVSQRAKVFLSYQESTVRLQDIIPLVGELAEKQSMLDMASERSRKVGVVPSPQKFSIVDSSELWDFLEGAVENIDTRERLIAEFRRASRYLLRASHAVFFLREADGFRADRGTSFFSVDDPMVAFLENHPAVIDGLSWDCPSDPVAELAIKNRLALWGAKLLAPIHDNGRLLGLVAFGVRDDGQAYDHSDRNRAVFFARLLRNFLAKCASFVRLNNVANQVALGMKYFPGTIVLGSDEAVPRLVPLVVRDLIGQVRRSREICRAAPCAGQPFRASAGIVAETGGVWAYWEEASGEVYDALARERAGRREVLRELALTLSHELGNSLVSLATFRQSDAARPLTPRLLETMKSDVSQLEALNGNLTIMQNLHEAESAEIDIRDIAQKVGQQNGIRVEVGPDQVKLLANTRLIEFALHSLIRAVADNRSVENGDSGITVKVRSTGTGGDVTALLSIKGKNLELEGVLPEPIEDSVPNLGRMSVFLAKEILRLHHGEIHAGPGMEGTEILISVRSW